MYSRTLNSDLPATIDEAASILLDDLRLLDRTFLGSMTTEKLNLLNKAVGLQISRDFNLWRGNEKLLDDCLKALEESGNIDADLTMPIIKAMWKKLQKTHVLRLIK